MLLDDRLEGLRSKRDVELRYVKGHSGVVGNEMADKLAVSIAQNIEQNRCAL